MNESRTRELLSIPRQGFNRLVQSSTKCINDYHNSSRIRHGTRLQVLSFDLKQCTCDPVYLRNSSDFLNFFS